jgi:hypothetical protein
MPQEPLCTHVSWRARQSHPVTVATLAGKLLVCPHELEGCKQPEVLFTASLAVIRSLRCCLLTLLTMPARRSAASLAASIIGAPGRMKAFGVQPAPAVPPAPQHSMRAPAACARAPLLNCPATPQGVLLVRFTHWQVARKSIHNHTRKSIHNCFFTAIAKPCMNKPSCSTATGGDPAWNSQPAAICRVWHVMHDTQCKAHRLS